MGQLALLRPRPGTDAGMRAVRRARMRARAQGDHWPGDHAASRLQAAVRADRQRAHYQSWALGEVDGPLLWGPVGDIYYAGYVGDTYYGYFDGSLTASRLQAVLRAKLVRDHHFHARPDPSAPPADIQASPQITPKITPGTLLHSPSPTSSTASAAPTASPCCLFSPNPDDTSSPFAPPPLPPPSPADVARAATVLSARARATLLQLHLRASQAAAATLTTSVRASLARSRDNNRRAALPPSRAVVVNPKSPVAPSGSSVSCSPTTSAVLPRASPVKSTSCAATARPGYIVAPQVRTAALPPDSLRAKEVQRKTPDATLAAPASSTPLFVGHQYAGPPRATPPGTSCKPELRPAAPPFAPGILPTPLPLPRPGILPDPPLSQRLAPFPPPLAPPQLAIPVNHTALLYFLHLQASYVHHLTDLFLRASLLPSAATPMGRRS